MAVTVFSPAKINLFLAVTGRRSDGFHDLVSLAAPLDFGDDLMADTGERGTGARFRLECAHPGVPLDGANLILKAANAFAAVTGWPDSASGGRGSTVHFKLVKRIPMGAGFGGGSSNAVAALRALNLLSGNLLSATELGGLAAKLGSDCAMFAEDAPVIMRGRGERIERVPESAARRLRGSRVRLFKPSFGISTPWAYGRMAAEAPRHYLPETEAGARLADWLKSDDPVSRVLFNNMERVAFGKFVALPVLLEDLRKNFGADVLMSGSGSGCFAVLAGRGPDDAGAPGIITGMERRIRRSWGDAVFVREANLP